jgi:hypothetical protein
MQRAAYFLDGCLTTLFLQLSVRFDGSNLANRTRISRADRYPRREQVLKDVHGLICHLPPLARANASLDVRSHRRGHVDDDFGHMPGPRARISHRLDSPNGLGVDHLALRHVAWAFAASNLSEVLSSVGFIE